MEGMRRLLVQVVCAAGAQAAIAAASFCLIYLAHRGPAIVLGAADRAIVLADVSFYASYAEEMRDGKLPYRDVRIEYPPLALPFFLLPALLGGPRRVYIAGFIVEMLLLNAATVWLVARWVACHRGQRAVPGSLLWYTACFAPLSLFAIGRFDAVPMFLGFAAACAWFGGRAALGGLLAAAGTLVKLSPGAIVLPALGSGLRSGGRPQTGFSVFFVSVLAGIALWLDVAGPGAWESIRYHSERGLEVGSVYAGLLALLGLAQGGVVELVYDHSSMTLVAPGTPLFKALAFPLQAAAILAPAVTCWLRHGREPMRYAGVAVLGFAIAGKVLSPQYLLWVLPFVAVSRDRRGQWLFLAAAVMTAILCPWAFRALARLEPAMIILLNLRNAALVSLWLRWTLGRPGTDPALAPGPGCSPPLV